MLGCCRARPMSEVGPGCVKTPTLNLRVEFLSQFRRCRTRLHQRLLLGESNEKTILRVLGSSEFSHSLGQKRKCRPVSSMSASPPKADIGDDDCYVRLVPQ